MTQPAQMQISVNAGIVPCPDGRHRIGLQVSDGAFTFGLILDPDSAGPFADGVAKALTEAARQAKLANGGLIIPTPGPLPTDLTMPPGSGHNGGRL